MKHPKYIHEAVSEARRIAHTLSLSTGNAVKEPMQLKALLRYVQYYLEGKCSCGRRAMHAEDDGNLLCKECHENKYGAPNKSFTRLVLEQENKIKGE